MAIDLTKNEIEILDRADNDLVEFGKTAERCPRCGNEKIFSKIFIMG